MKLYGANLSPFVRKALVVLKEKGLQFDHEPTMPGDNSPEFRAISPTGKVPGFVDGDLQVADSSVICDYLEEAYPETTRMQPEDPQNRARARFLEEYADSTCAATAAAIFFERVAKPTFFGGETDETRVEQLITEELPPVLDYLESRVPAEGFMFGAFGTVDISLASPFINAGYGGYTVDAQRWPGFAAYYQRVLDHPSVAEALVVEQEMMKAMGMG